MQRLTRISAHLIALPTAAADPVSALSSDVLLVNVEKDGVATVIFNRAEAKNAFTFAMLNGFRDAMWHLGQDPAVRVIIITGTGDSFCSGTDLKELNKTTPANRGRGDRQEKKDGNESRKADFADMPKELKRWNAWFIASCPKPVICALNGMAVGMGAEFVTQCDIRICSEKGRVNWVFAKRGLVPDMGASNWLLPRMIGHQHSLRLLYTADFHDADYLKNIGFAHEVVPHESLMDTALKEARRYLSQSPLALSMIKRTTYLGLDSSLADHLLMHNEVMQLCFASADHQEGVKSFVEKRSPNFTGAMPRLAEKYPKTARLLK